MRTTVIPLLKKPGELAKHSAFRLRWRCADSRRREFWMAMIQQVPPNDRNFEIFDGTPGEAKVEAEVTGHAQRAQCVHVAQGSVKFQIVRQVDAGSNAELVMRALTFDGFVRAIVAAGVAVQ